MHDESTERAAQEFLAAKLAEEEQLNEGRLKSGSGNGAGSSGLEASCRQRTRKV